MPAIQMVFGILLAVVALGLVVVVLLQPGKDKRLSGAIAGGSETYFGKSKGASREKILNKITVVMCIILFVLLVAFVCVDGIAPTK